MLALPLSMRALSKPLSTRSSPSFSRLQWKAPSPSRLSNSPLFQNRFVSTSSSKDSLANPSPPSVASTLPDNVHFNKKNADDYNLPHPIWSPEELKEVEKTHRQPSGAVEKLAYASIQLIRKVFDMITGYGKRDSTGKSMMTADQWILRITFLETVAGVPGMMGAMVRHLKSLRVMGRDHGWIHTLLEEAENERMHLLVALKLRQPTAIMRFFVMLTQGIAANAFFLIYLVAPRFCHSFVGFLEEEAVATYTRLLDEIDNGPMEEWQTAAAPPIAVTYWKLGEKATMRDVIEAIRADESHHRDVNHKFSEMKPDEDNPFKAGH
eukprot:TRINITY_DN6965_c0_g1_i1.p1 TRINITY_DN6965_c0_g1~~TRINITY_DN6965_c0_g1_i1.p1  ORF type:complete len:344 (-),score=86.34 TRINITY_DN6965_c0_g1_i1:418-1386(-)